MAAENGFYLAVLGMAVASYACRVGGFLLMGWVPITPRLEAARRGGRRRLRAWLRWPW